MGHGVHGYVVSIGASPAENYKEGETTMAEHVGPNRAENVPIFFRIPRDCLVAGWNSVACQIRGQQLLRW